MNWFKFHIGDWTTAVRFLTPEKEGFYVRLLTLYYSTERPIPADVAQACEEVGACTPEQQAIVEVLLRKFFTLQDDGWHQKRCDEEIAAARESIEDADAKRENEKERQRRHRERRAQMYEELRALGHVPKWDTPTSELIETLERLRAAPPVPPVTPPVTRDRPLPVTPGHAPETAITRSQEPEAKSQEQQACVNGAAPDPEWSDEPATAGQLCMVARRHSIDCGPGDQRLIELVKQGISEATMDSACRQACTAKRGERVPIGYVIGIIEGWAKAARRIAAKGAQIPAARASPARTDLVVVGGTALTRHGAQTAQAAASWLKSQPQEVVDESV